MHQPFATAEQDVFGPIDAGQHVGCMEPDCGDLAALMWVDRFHPWLVVLCAEHGRTSLPEEAVIANPVFFDSCPPDLEALASAHASRLQTEDQARLADG